MNLAEILSQIDAEIATLQQARSLIASTEQNSSPTPKPASVNKRKKRKLSPEGRARIVAALKARWAAKKK
jgi:hypothetical protein